MLYKFSLSVTGEFFLAENATTINHHKFFCDDLFNPDTPKFFIDPNEDFAFGSASYLHPMKYVCSEYLDVYENDFIDFLKTNFQTWSNYGATDFKIYIVVLSNGDRNDMEVFTNTKLKQLANMNVSINITFHNMPSADLKLWERDVKSKWKRKYIP